MLKKINPDFLKLYKFFQNDTKKKIKKNLDFSKTKIKNIQKLKIH